MSGHRDAIDLREVGRRETYRAARSNLAALQATLPDFSTLSYSQVLLALDAAHDGALPATGTVEESGRQALYLGARAGLEALADARPGCGGGADLLAIELVIADLDAVWADDVRTGGLGDLP